MMVCVRQKYLIVRVHAVQPRFRLASIKSHFRLESAVQTSVQANENEVTVNKNNFTAVCERTPNIVHNSTS